MNQPIPLRYRGVRYEGRSPVVPARQFVGSGHYRGLPVRFSVAEPQVAAWWRGPASALRSRFRLTYRGVPYWLAPAQSALVRSPVLVAPLDWLPLAPRRSWAGRSPASSPEIPSALVARDRLHQSKHTTSTQPNTASNSRHLDQSNLEQFNLDQSDLEPSEIIQSEIIISNKNQQTLEQSEIIVPDTHQQTLEQSEIMISDVNQKTLGQSNLECLELKQSDLENSNLEFISSKSGQPSLGQSSLNQSGSKQSGSEQSGLESSYLGNSDSNQQNLGKFNLDQSDLDQSELERSKLDQANLDRADLEQSDLEQSDLNQSDLNQSDLNQSDLEQSDLNQSDLNQSDLEQSDSDQFDLTQLNFDQANHPRSEQTHQTHQTNINSSWVAFTLRESDSPALDADVLRSRVPAKQGNAASRFTERQLPIAVGSRGPEVAIVQGWLRRRGVWRRRVTSYFDPLMREAVRDFQRQCGLRDDGIVDAETYAHLQRPR